MKVDLYNFLNLAIAFSLVLSGVRGKRAKWVTRVTLWDDRDDHVGGVG